MYFLQKYTSLYYLLYQLFKHINQSIMRNYMRILCRRRFSGVLRWLVICACGLVGEAVSAQTSFGNMPKDNAMESYAEMFDIKDSTIVQFVFQHVMRDPSLNQTRVAYDILSIGNRMSVFENYGQYQLDSTFNARHGERYSFADYHELSELFDRRSNRTIKSYGDSVLTHIDWIGDMYFYQEPIPAIDWNTDYGDSRVILGYDCNKATAKWRGREWTAWYAYDVPFADGPYKFGGLPGMILALSDSTGNHKFMAIESRISEYPLGEKRKVKKSAFKAKRERFNVLERDHALNSAQKMLDAGMLKLTPEQKKTLRNRRLFYSPIELE